MILKGIAMANKTRKIPNLITYLPVSTSDLIFGGLGLFYVSRLLNIGLEALPNEMIPYTNQIINWYLPHYSTLLVNTTFAGMIGSGIIDYLRTPKISHKEDISEKLFTERKYVNIKTRKDKVNELCLEISDDYTEKTRHMKEEAEIANKTLEDIIYQIEGVRIKTSDKIKNSYLTKYLMPHALGGCNIISSDIDIFQQLPYISFSTVAHELAHRKRYFKENDAEVLAHLAGFATKDPVFIQSSRVSRLRREYQTIFEKYGNINKEMRKQLNEECEDFLNDLKLPYKVKEFIIASEFRKHNLITEGMKKGQMALYKAIMKIFGQKEGLNRYTRVFTEDLYALEKKYSSIENLIKSLNYLSWVKKLKK